MLPNLHSLSLFLFSGRDHLNLSNVTLAPQTRADSDTWNSGSIRRIPLQVLTKAIASTARWALDRQLTYLPFLDFLSYYLITITAQIISVTLSGEQRFSVWVRRMRATCGFQSDLWHWSL
jgi:hypothetical protein